MKLISHYPSGGLGNQLFDYAAVRTLADRKGAQLLLDASLLAPFSDNHDARTLVLDRFSVRARFRCVRRTDRPASIGKRLLRRIREDLGAVRVHREKHEYRFYDGFWDIPPRAILHGHFLSPKFFASNVAAIRADLTLAQDNTLHGERGLNFLARIRRATNAVAIHVRRGDFLLPINSWLRPPGIERYHCDAIDFVRHRCGDARFFVFSDDPGWCREHLARGTEDVEVVSGGPVPEDTTLSDFHLMQQCRHVIMANSTYSWWAAFLRDRQEGITLLPSRWDARDETPIEEMLMPGWRALG